MLRRATRDRSRVAHTRTAPSHDRTYRRAGVPRASRDGAPGILSAGRRADTAVWRTIFQKRVYHVRVNSSTTRAHRNWQAGELFTVTDAAELYEVARWGKGYFSISPSGHVLVHPTKDPARSIDLKQLID